MSTKQEDNNDVVDLFSAAGLTEHVRPQAKRVKSMLQHAKTTATNTTKTVRQTCDNEALNDCYLRDKEVAYRYGVCRQTVWRWVRLGNFPAPVKLSNGVTRWRLSELVAHDAIVGAKARYPGRAKAIGAGQGK